ncbi:conserved hypothetical protein [Phenylobacterium zucineum HLK1]|uniref:Helix-turn-helix domain-containing protein n=1 Tax=Phenylobacterium zucineum (strain HLK1) TaxID=450851 RepID=B4RFU2_PHEZH|nr:helix-turn-helix domain-containing protein [Phenylobacterium zucineum]ACG78755.1 conserved hypothetical protein [Phenylobacterium zucineum HLK1]
MHEEQPLPTRFLRTHEAGRFLGLSGRTLEKHRVYGTGPAYRKVGGRVIYAVEDLQAWAEQGRQLSTSDVRRTQPARPTPEQRTFQFMRELPRPAAR